MTDFASLGIKIDSADVERGGKSLDDLAQAGAKAETATKKLTSASEVLANAARAAAGAFAAFKILDHIKEVSLLNARYETLGVSMRVVGGHAGYSASQMDATETALRKTGISMIEARQQAMRLVQAHIDLADSTKLARIAQDAAVIGGINSSEAFERMINGITTGQTEILRGIGINVSMENSYKTMAATLHKHADQLSQNEKMQAVVNAVMEKGKDIAGAYEAAMDTAGKQITSMTRYTEDLKVKQGEVFNEALTIAVMAWTAHLKDANGEIDKLAQNNELEAWGASLTNLLAGLADNADNLAGAIKIVALSAAAAAAMAANAFNPDAIKAIRDAYDSDVDAVLAKQDRFAKAVEDRRAALAETKNKVAEEEKAHQESMTNIMLYYTDLRIKGMMTEQAYLATVTAINNQANDGHHYTDTPVVKAPSNALSEYQKLTKAIKEKIAAQEIEIALGENATAGQKDYQKFLADVTGGYLKLKPVEIARIAILHDQNLANERAIALTAERVELEKSFAAEANEIHTAWLDAHKDTIAELQKEIEQQLEHNATVGLSKEALTKYADAKYADAIATKERELAVLKGTTADEEQLDLIRSEIKALEQLRAAKMDGAAADVAADAAKKAVEDWKKTSESIERSLTDSLMRGFEAGDGFAKNFWKNMINMAKTVVLRPIIQGAVQGGMNAVGLGSGQGGAGGFGDILSAGNGIYGLSSGGGAAAGMYSAFATSSVGSSLGLSTPGLMGPTMTGEALSGLTTLGSSIGAAIPYVAAFVAAITVISSLLGEDHGPKTEGDYFGTIGKDGALTQANSATGGDGTWFTAGGADAQVKAIAAPVAVSIWETIKALGGDATGLGIDLGYNTDPSGHSPDNVSGGLSDKNGNYVYRQTYDVGNGGASAALQLEFKRLTLAAVEAADGIDPFYRAVAGSIDLMTASAEQIDATFAQIGNAKSIFDYVHSDPFGDYATAAKNAGMTLMESFESQKIGVRGLALAFDGSAASTAMLADKTKQLYQTEFAIAQQIDQIRAGFSASTDSDIRGYKLSTMDKEGQYGFLDHEAAGYLQQIKDSTDPAKIAQLSASLSADRNAAWGLLTDDQKRTHLDEFVQRAEDDRTAVNEQLTRAGDVVREGQQELASVIGTAMDRGADALVAAADRIAAAADKPVTVVVDYGSGFGVAPRSNEVSAGG